MSENYCFIYYVHVLIVYYRKRSIPIALNSLWTEAKVPVSLIESKGFKMLMGIHFSQYDDSIFCKHFALKEALCQ